MNRSIKFFAVILFDIICISGLHAQEIVTPLWGNSQVARYSSSREYHSMKDQKKSSSTVMLEIPFFDDFSNSNVIPNTEFWSDAYAFVNNNYCFKPITNGVATFDAVDAKGIIYSTAVLSPSTFVADHLTSHPFDLTYPAADSLYFSFVYQPGGLCDLPEDQDSLMVDFYAPDSAEWINVWRVSGGNLQPFRQVMIPITNEKFLTNGFMFRFRNRASLSSSNDYPDMRSNVDYWHVDYVQLDRNRFAADTVFRDVAFNTNLNSILKDLTSLPWSHFEKAYNTVLDPFVIANYLNNDTIARNVTRSLVIHDPIYNETYAPGSPTAQDLPAQEDTLVKFGYIYPFKFDRGDSAIFRFKAALRTDEFDPKVNDTVIHEQVFKNYYAYDDGTPEAGYGLRGGGTSDGIVAMKYYSFQPDQLGGVKIFFNQVHDSLNLNYYFNLVVWDDLDGQPGSIIWEDENEFHSIYNPSYPGFIEYTFSQPVPVEGTFYVGWRQYNEYLLNVGLDFNNKPSPTVMFYNLQGTWETSAAPGVIMFRPFLYDPSTDLVKTPAESASFQIYPNPARNMVYFQLPGVVEGTRIRIEMFDASGRMVGHSLTQTNNMDVSRLSPGIYYIRALIDRDVYHSKLLINP